MVTIPKPVLVIVSFLLPEVAASGQQIITNTRQTPRAERRAFDNAPGWVWLMRPQELKVGHRLGQSSEGLIISGYSVIDDSGVLRVFIVQTGPKMVDAPAYRLVAFDRAGNRYILRQTEAGGFGSGEMRLSNAVFALDPKALAPANAVYLGIERLTP